MSVSPGRCPTCGCKRSAWTMQAILGAVNEWRRVHGRQPIQRDWLCGTADHPSDSTVRRMFGSWNAMIVAAGMKPNRYGGGHFSWTRDTIAGVMLDFLLREGRWPTTNDFRAAENGLPTPATVSRQFGSWEAAKRYAGWLPNQPAPWTCAGCGITDLEDFTSDCRHCYDRRRKRGPAGHPGLPSSAGRSPDSGGATTLVKQTVPRKRQLTTARSDKEGR